jgi:hypothetical protein
MILFVYYAETKPHKNEETSHPVRVSCTWTVLENPGGKLNMINTMRIAQMNKNVETTTQDIWMASYAVQKGYEMIGLRELGGRKLFVFTDSEAFQDMKRDYYWHRGQVDPLKLKRSVRELKTLAIGG